MEFLIFFLGHDQSIDWRRFVPLFAMNDVYRERQLQRYEYKNSQDCGDHVLKGEEARHFLIFPSEEITHSRLR